MSNCTPEALARLNDAIIDNIFPVEELHLICGPSGSGKSTWLLKTIQSWQAGQSVFGHKSHPAPFLYMSLDRSEKGMWRIMQRLGLPPDSLPLFVPKGTERKLPLEALLRLQLQEKPDCRVFFIEGLASRVPEGKINDYAVVADFLTGLADFCAKYHVTIIGVVHSAKTKEGERYVNPRQRALGSVAWAAFSETIILIEPVSPDNPDDTVRELYFLPRNSREEKFRMNFKDGYLVPVARNNKEKFTTYLSTLGVGEEFTSPEAIAEASMPESSFYREADVAIKSGTITSPRKGVYIKIKEDN